MPSKKKVSAKKGLRKSKKLQPTKPLISLSYQKIEM